MSKAKRQPEKKNPQRARRSSRTAPRSPAKKPATAKAKSKDEEE